MGESRDLKSEWKKKKILILTSIVKPYNLLLL